MSTIEPLCKLIGINPDLITKEEVLLLECDILLRLCEELKKFFKEHHKDELIAMKLNTKMENATLEAQLLYLIVKDILSSEEYTPKGMARYIDTHEDVIEEVLFGRNTDPSARLFRKAIELHRTIRRDLYSRIIKKITAQYLAI